jgi:hypothetical protein
MGKWESKTIKFYFNRIINEWIKKKKVIEAEKKPQNK